MRPKPGVEPVTRTAARRIPIAASTQEWRDVVFLHWPYDPADLEHLAPRGTRLDVHDDRTWVGVVGLRLTGVRLGGRLPLPHLGHFDELNVRLYTIGEDGRRSTAFLTMEATRLPVVTASRAVLRLPYAWADVVRHRHGDIAGYSTTRRLPPPAGVGVGLTVRIGERYAPGAADDFVTARWGTHTPWYGRPLFIPFEHEPWPLHTADLLDYTDNGLFAAVGIPAPAQPPTSVLFAPAVRPRSGLPLPTPGHAHPH